MEAMRCIQEKTNKQINSCCAEPDKANENLILFTPDYSRSNSYQSNLYSQARQYNFLCVPVKSLALSLEFYNPKMYRRFVVHQHWLKDIYWTATNEIDGISRINHHVSLIKAYKAFGAEVVWTLHNLIDHDASPLQETLCRNAIREIARVSNKIFIHDIKAGEQLSAICGFDTTEKCILLEHPLYDELLELADPQLPSELNLKDINNSGQKVLLHAGMIRPYKGITDLLRAFESLTTHNPNHDLMLIIAGKIYDPDLPRVMSSISAESQKRITVIPRRLSDEEIAALMRLADVNVTPYRKILTSGSFYLATTFGKPTLAPAIGMFPEVIQHEHSGFLYDGSVDDLECALNAINSMPRSHLSRIGRKVFETHKNLSVPNVSKLFFDSLKGQKGMQVLAYDAMWQEPARTEKHALDMIRNANAIISGATYIGFPWATLIDAIERNMPQVQMLDEKLNSLLSRLKRARPKIVVSVCQHIKYQKYLATFRRAGITDLYCSHAVTGSRIEHGIRIWPFQLYPTQSLNASNGTIGVGDHSIHEFLNRDIDYSYIGAYDSRCYLTDARQIITDMLSSHAGAYIKSREEWHYEKQVYTKQIYGKELDQSEIEDEKQREIEYREIMSRSKFVLCPSGSGPNSIRFWEALEFGCIPILLSDKLALPGDETEWASGVLRVTEDEKSIQQIPALVKDVLMDHVGLSRRLATLRSLHAQYGVKNMVRHLLDRTRSQASAMRSLDVAIYKLTVFIDGRQQPPQLLKKLIDGVHARLGLAGIAAQVITWDNAGIARDDNGVEICHSCEPLSLVDTSRPFGLIFSLHSLTSNIASNITQLIFLPVAESPVEAQNGNFEMTSFDVTLISSVFKGRQFLPAFLDSISAYTSKAVTEHLMIIAASPEDELSMIAQYQHTGSANVTVIYLPADPGLYEVWNFGLSLASGRYVGNANLDDFRAPRQIELLVDLLEKNPSVDVASTAIAVAAEPTADWNKIKDLPVWFTNVRNGCYEGKDLFRLDQTGQVTSNNIPHCMPLWRRSLHELHGYFDEKRFGPSADWEFWLRCGAAGVRFGHLNEVLGIYYKNQNTYWRRNPNTKLLELNVISRHFCDGRFLSHTHLRNK